MHFDICVYFLRFCVHHQNTMNVIRCKGQVAGINQSAHFAMINAIENNEYLSEQAGDDKTQRQVCVSCMASRALLGCVPGGFISACFHKKIPIKMNKKNNSVGKGTGRGDGERKE